MHAMVDVQQQRADRNSEIDDDERHRHDQVDVVQADAVHQQVAQAVLRREHLREPRYYPWAGLLWRDEFDRRKAGAVTPDVARQQRAVGDRGMRADEEVGQNVAFATAGSSVAQQGPTREKKCGSRNVGHRQPHPADDGLQRFDGRKRQ
jgi:hypothetical protein